EGALTEARVRVDRFNFGPPVGFPVQFRVMGQDPQQVRDIAYRVRDVLRDVANSLQLLISGVTVTTVRDGIDKVAVVARAIPEERADLARLGDLTIVSRNGAPVPVSQVAKVVYDHEDAILWRRNRDTTITVRSDVVDGVQPPEVSNRVWARLGELRAALPPGYRLEMGGAIEESAKGNNSLFAVFPVMILVMLTIVMAQLQNFARLGLVMMSAPLGIIGATLGLKLAGAPFGFVALLGMIALSGM